MDGAPNRRSRVGVQRTKFYGPSVDTTDDIDEIAHHEHVRQEIPGVSVTLCQGLQLLPHSFPRHAILHASAHSQDEMMG